MNAVKHFISALALVVVSGCGRASGKPAPDARPPVGFAIAREAFRGEAVRQLGYIPERLGLVPERDPDAEAWVPEAGVFGAPLPSERHTKIGDSWAFEARRLDPPFTVLRGWATPDGAVMTARENLGKLLQQAGLWSNQRMSADVFGREYLWALDEGWEFGLTQLGTQSWPKLDIDGVGQFSMFVQRAAAVGVEHGEIQLDAHADHTAALYFAPGISSWLARSEPTSPVPRIAGTPPR